MEKPNWTKLTDEEKAEGCKLVRFIDQIVLLNRQGRALRRVFFPSRNLAKRFNRETARLPVLSENPKNAGNCLNQMARDTTAMPAKNPTLRQRRLDSRRADYLKTLAPKNVTPGTFSMPGSYNK